MHIYCKKCCKHIANTYPKMITLISKNKCSVCGTKNPIFVKKQDAEGLLSNLGIKIPLSKIPLLNLLF